MSHKDEIGPFKITLKNADSVGIKPLEFEGSSNAKTFLWKEKVPVGNYEAEIKTKYGFLPFNKVKCEDIKIVILKYNLETRNFDQRE